MFGWGFWLFAIVWQQTTPTTTPASSTASSTTGNPILDVFLSFGPIGAVLIAAATGYIWFKPSIDQLKEDKELLQEVNAKLVLTYEQEAIPALHEAVTAVRASAEAMTDMKVEVAAMRSELGATTAKVAELLEIMRRWERRRPSEGGTS